MNVVGTFSKYKHVLLYCCILQLYAQVRQLVNFIQTLPVRYDEVFCNEYA